jgi:tetratricopeptide (TPR) repeat protein
MKLLFAADSHHLDSAIGWIELGNHFEANDELDKINPELRSHPEVLKVRWQICAAEKKWDGCLNIANELLITNFNEPHGWIRKAVALHELNRTQEAYDHLETAADMFPENWLIRYQLAGYACRLHQRRQALVWLESALDLGDAKAIKLMALDDPLLEPFRRALEER